MQVCAISVSRVYVYVTYKSLFAVVDVHDTYPFKERYRVFRKSSWKGQYSIMTCLRYTSCTYAYFDVLFIEYIYISWYIQERYSLCVLNMYSAYYFTYTGSSTEDTYTFGETVPWCYTCASSYDLCSINALLLDVSGKVLKES